MRKAARDIVSGVLMSVWFMFVIVFALFLVGGGIAVGGPVGVPLGLLCAAIWIGAAVTVTLRLAGDC